MKKEMLKREVDISNVSNVYFMCIICSSLYFFVLFLGLFIGVKFSEILTGFGSGYIFCALLLGWYGVLRERKVYWVRLKR